LTPRIKYPRLPTHLDTRRSISDETKREIRRLRNEDKKRWTYSELARKFKINPTSASRICNPELMKRANEATKRIYMEKYWNDTEFRAKEAQRVKELIKRRERIDPKFNKYQNQFKKYRKDKPNLKAQVDSLN